MLTGLQPWHIWAALLAVIPTQTYAQAPVPIAAGPLAQLVKGKTLAISFYGDPSQPAATYLWDFKTDGSICARIIGAKRSDKCAEEGKWNTDGAFLCWELPNMGKSLGTNPACSSFLQLGPDRYEIRNKKTPDLKFATVQVLR
jgi:hypothetical protein